MKADKENGGICFNEEHHVYWDKNDKTKKFISVTTLIERFGQDYDAEFWSHYKGLQALVQKEKWRDISRKLLEEKKLAKLTILPKVGCEGLADMLYKYVNGVYIPEMWGPGEAERLWCYRVEVRETQSNMAFREGHREWNEDLFA